MKKTIVSLFLIAGVCINFGCGSSDSSGSGSSGSSGSGPGGQNKPGFSDQGSKIADHTVINDIRLGVMPVEAIEQAKQKLVIGYGHTSHGCQVLSGMEGLVGFANGRGCNRAYSSHEDLFVFTRDGSVSSGALRLYNGAGYDPGELRSTCGSYDASLEYDEYVATQTGGSVFSGDSISWHYETMRFLGEPNAQGRGSLRPEYNVIVWSWCGELDEWDRDEAVVYSNYIAPMEELEILYPGVTFVYMTGHLVGKGENVQDNHLYTNNNYIRQYCKDNNKWLYDFADIESYDPDGQEFFARLANDGCVYDSDGDGVSEFDIGNGTIALNGDSNWALEWQANPNHEQGTDWYYCHEAETNHTISVNENMKAYAAWWLWCRLGGWGSDGN